MADDAAVDTGLETTDQSVVDSAAEQVETPVNGAENVETEGKPPQAGQPYRAVTEDGKRLDEKARATIEEIRAKDPALAKELRNALFEVDRFKREVPGGLTEVRELRQAIENLGGEPGIREAQEKLAGWDSFDDQYMAGDPKALEFMLSSPESQQAFLKLAPMAFNKFEEMNPEGYAAYISQRVIGDALANRIPVAIELTQHFLAAGDTAKATEEFGKILAWFQGLDATSKKAVNAPQSKAPNAADDPRFKELVARDTERTRDEWRRETATEQNRVYASELNRFLAGRKVTDIQREDILHRVQTKLGLRIKEQEKTLDRYFSAKDKEGFLKFANSFSRKHIPELLREAVDRYVPTKPGPKAPPTQNGAPVRPPVGGKPAQGFAYVQEMPGRDKIDWSNPFNTLSNIKDGKAITLDGKRVTWRK